MSRPTHIPSFSTPVRGYHPLRPTFPSRSGWRTTGIGLVRVRSPLLAESLLMSFPPGTEMFQFPGFASLAGYPCGWVSPFGNPRIKACSQLPMAYRSVPRPSSPLSAKASTRYPCCTRSLSLPMSTRPSRVAWPARSNVIERPLASRVSLDAPRLAALDEVTGSHDPAFRPNEPSLHDVHGTRRTSTLVEGGKTFSSLRTRSTRPTRLVEPDGIEPTTSCLQSTRSPN